MSANPYTRFLTLTERANAYDADAEFMRAVTASERRRAIVAACATAVCVVASVALWFSGASITQPLFLSGLSAVMMGATLTALMRVHDAEDKAEADLIAYLDSLKPRHLTRKERAAQALAGTHSCTVY